MSAVVLFGPFPPPYGGVASYLESLSEYLAARGIAHDTRPYRGEHTSSSSDVVQSFASIRRHFGSIGRGDVCLDSSGFFVEYPSPRGFAAWVACRARSRFRWIKVLHDGSCPARFADLPIHQKLTSCAAARSADRIVAVSDELAAWVTETLAVPAARVSVIGSLLPLPSGAPAALPADLETMFSAPGAHVVCAVGALTRDYGVVDVAAAVERVRQHCEADIRLLLLDPGFAAEAEGVREALVTGRPWVTIVQGLPRPSVLAAFRRSAAFVRATRFESVGLSRIEALLCGVPVVATRVGETRGMLLYDHGDVGALAAQLERALFDGGVAGSAEWTDRFKAEADRNAAALLSLIGEPAVVRS